MTRQFYIGMIAAFALGLALGAALVSVPTHKALELGKKNASMLEWANSDRDQAYGRLDECEGIIKAHKWEDMGAGLTFDDTGENNGAEKIQH